MVDTDIQLLSSQVLPVWNKAGRHAEAESCDLTDCYGFVNSPLEPCCEVRSDASRRWLRSLDFLLSHLYAMTLPYARGGGGAGSPFSHGESAPS